MLFDGWTGILRILITGSAAYAALVVLLRVSGKRTLSKLNAFDLVVTVALGSTLASILTSRDVPLAEGVTALALLVVLQFGVAWGACRWPRLDRVVKSEPRLLFHHGSFVVRAMREERLTEEEVISAARSASFSSLDEVESVVLESSGEISVVARDAGRVAARATPGAPRGNGRGTTDASRTHARWHDA